MKQLRFVLSALMLLIAVQVAAEAWSYGFGTGTTSYTTNNSSSATFLPDQPAGGGTHKVWRSNNKGGGFYRDDPGLTDFGSDTELRINASSGTGNDNINKYSVYNYTQNTGFLNYFKTQLRFGSESGGNATSGTFCLFLGQYNRNTYNNNDPVPINDDSLTGFKWVLGDNGSVVTSRALAGTWNASDNFQFQQGVNYTLEIFGFWHKADNDVPQQNVYYNNGSDYVTNGTFDLWINGTKWGDNLSTIKIGGHGNAHRVGSFAFWGESSTNNVGNLFLDNMVWANSFDNSTQPLNIAYANIKAFLQGPYVPGSKGSMTHALTLPLTSPYNGAHTVTALPNVSPKFIVDWIYLQLRSTYNGAVLQSQSAFLLNDGSVVSMEGTNGFNFTGVVGNNYYLVVRHRNHLGIQSASTHTFSDNSVGAPTIDLTASGSVYGGDGSGAIVIETGVLALFCGDADGNGQVQNSDVYDYILPQVGPSGYYMVDTDLNGQCQNSDAYDYTMPNAGSASQIPE